jgi:hypothetical protein
VSPGEDRCRVGEGNADADSFILLGSASMPLKGIATRRVGMGVDGGPRVE